MPTRARGSVKPLAGLVLLAAACAAPAPRPLVAGEDTCTHCHMRLADLRFGAELVTVTGKTLPFDDAGCLAAHLLRLGTDTALVHSLWVSDLTRPESLLPARQAVFVRHPSFRTPMDHGIVALASAAAADRLIAGLGGGEKLDWTGVLRVVAEGSPP